MHTGYHIRLAITPPPPHHAHTSSSFRPPAATAHAEHVPSSLFEPLPAHPPKPTARRYTFHHPRDQSVSEQERKDYRFGRIRIDWVDFATNTMDAKAKASVGKEKEKHVRGVYPSRFSL